MRAKGIDHVGQAIGEAAEAGDEQPLQTDIDVEIEAGDHRAGIGIGEGRAIAEELRQDVDIAGQQRRLSQVGARERRAVRENRGFLPAECAVAAAS